MNQNSIPMMTMIAPDLAVQQQEVANRELLAKLLLTQGNRQNWAQNPSPTGAALGSIGDALREGVGMWALLKNQGDETDLVRQQVAAQNQLLQQGFGGQDQEYALPGPAFAGSDTPESAYTPYQGSIGPVQVDPIKVKTSGPLVMPGMTSDQAKLAFMLDQPGYMSALANTYSHNAQLPDEVKVRQWQGVTPEQSRGLWMANQLKDATQSYGPNTTVIPPSGSPFMTPSAAPAGGMTVMTSSGPQVVPVPGAAAVNAGYAGSEEEARRQAVARNAMVNTLGPDGRPVATRQSEAYGRPTGLNPWEEASSRAGGAATQEFFTLKGPNGEDIVVRKSELPTGTSFRGPAPAETTRQTERAKYSEQENNEVEQTVRKGAETSYLMRQDTRQIKNLLAQGYQPGYGASLVASFGRVLSSFGANTDKAQEYVQSKKFDQAAKELTKSMIGGNIAAQGFTEKDREFIENTVPQLKDSAAAAQAMAEFIDNKAAIAQQRYDQMQQAKGAGLSQADFNRRWMRMMSGEKSEPRVLPDGRHVILNIVTNQWIPYE